MKKNLILICLAFLSFASCNDGGWSQEEKDQFIKNCAVDPSMKDYCDCALEKVMQQAPNPEDAMNIDIMEVAKSCADQMPQNLGEDY